MHNKESLCEWCGSSAVHYQQDVFWLCQQWLKRCKSE